MYLPLKSLLGGKFFLGERGKDEPVTAREMLDLLTL